MFQVEQCQELENREQGSAWGRGEAGTELDEQLAEARRADGYGRSAAGRRSVAATRGARTAVRACTQPVCGSCTASGDRGSAAPATLACSGTRGTDVRRRTQTGASPHARPTAASFHATGGRPARRREPGGIAAARKPGGGGPRGCAAAPGTQRVCGGHAAAAPATATGGRAHAAPAGVAESAVGRETTALKAGGGSIRSRIRRVQCGAHSGG